MPRREAPPPGASASRLSNLFCWRRTIPAQGRQWQIPPAGASPPRRTGKPGWPRFSGPADPRQPPQGVKQPPRCSIFLLYRPQSLNKTKQKNLRVGPAILDLPPSGAGSAPRGRGAACPHTPIAGGAGSQDRKEAPHLALKQGRDQGIGDQGPGKLGPRGRMRGPLPSPAQATPLLSRRSPLPPVRCTRWPMPWRQASRWEFDIA